MTTPTNNPDVVLVGAGIMSTTLAVTRGASVEVNWSKWSLFFSRRRRPIHPLTGTTILPLSTSLRCPVFEFTTAGGETFTIYLGDVLLATDHIGSGHKWRLLNDEPRRRDHMGLIR